MYIFNDFFTCVFWRKDSRTCLFKEMMPSLLLHTFAGQPCFFLLQVADLVCSMQVLGIAVQTHIGCCRA